MIEHDDPLASGQSAFLLESQKKALAALLMALSIAAPLITLGVTLREGFSALAGVGGSLTLVVWLSLWLFRCGRTRLAAHTVVFAVLAASVVGVVAHGTVRSAAVLVMLAGVVAAGSFLPRRTMILAALFSIAALAVLNAMESYGMLRQPNLQVGWALWITQTAVLVSVLVSVFHGRHRTREAFINHEHALARAAEIETDLRASEARFMSLFRNTPAACLVQDLKTRTVLDVNDAFIKMFGYQREALLGRAPPNLWADPGERLAFRARMRVEGRVNGLQAQGLRNDGSSFDGLLFSEILTQGADQLALYMTLDVSPEMASRRAMEQSEERFSKAFNFSPLGMTITRLSDGRFMEVNPANERVLGYTQDDFAGQTASSAGVWLTDGERDAYMQTLRRDGRLVAYETRMRSKGGEPVDVRVWAEIIDIDGEPCALSFTLNVADEKRRETMLMTVAEGVSTHTGEAYFLSAAEHLARAVGAQGVVIGELDAHNQLGTLALMQDAELQPNRSLPLQHTGYARLLLQDDLLLLDNRSKQIIRSCPPFDPDQMEAFAGVTLRDADGSVVGLLAVTWQHMPDYGESMRALLSIFASRCNAELLRLRRDREIRKLQESLELRVAERTAQLEYLNRELETFSYSVSHDLKSPLRSMDGFMHLLREQMAPRMTAEDDDLVERIAASVTRMNSLINDLLALARVSQGQLQRMRVNLSELAEDVIRQERHRDPTREVEVVIPPGLMANCDPRLAHIVLENLLGNAWKYSRNQPHARIELDRCTDPASGISGFMVTDNGAGFDMARADRLFKPFTRLHSPKEFEGSGIGLATVRRIIERHGGQIQGKGATGQGASFCFFFGPETA